MLFTFSVLTIRFTLEDFQRRKEQIISLKSIKQITKYEEEKKIIDLKRDLICKWIEGKKATGFFSFSSFSCLFHSTISVLCPYNLDCIMHVCKVKR